MATNYSVKESDLRPVESAQAAKIIDDEKPHDERLEDLNVGQYESVVPKPASIANYTDSELRELEVKMVRKLDMFVLPIVGLLYIMNYVDRSGLAASKVYGITTDLKMSTKDFATAIAILFATYIPAQIPSNILVSRLPRPGFYICVMATVWGAVSACTAAVKTKEQLFAVRVCLGLTEAPFFPGALYFLSAWYVRKELAKRIAALYMFQALGQALGGFIAAGCLKLDGVHGIAGWRWLFIVEGVATIGLGIIFSFVVPEFPHNARILKPVERDFAVWRLEAESGATEVHENVGTWESFKLAIMDKKVWLLIWCGGMGQVMGSVFNFFPTIISSLGYGRYDTLLLTVPPYVAAMIGYYIAAVISDRYGTIYWLAISVLGFSVPVYILGMFAPNVAGRYVAMMFMPVTGVVPQVMLNKTMSLHIARPHTKRAAALAMMNSIGGISNVWTSYVWFGGPHFYPAFGTLLGAGVVFAASLTGYRFWVLHLNKKLGGTPEEQQNVMDNHNVTQEMVDLNWRYVGY